LRPVLAYTSATSPNGFKAKVVFDEIEKQMKQEGAAYVKKIKGVFCFKIQKGPGGKEAVWVVDAKHGSGSVKFGSSGNNFKSIFSMFKLLKCIVVFILLIA